MKSTESKQPIAEGVEHGPYAGDRTIIGQFEGLRDAIYDALEANRISGATVKTLLEGAAKNELNALERQEEIDRLEEEQRSKVEDDACTWMEWRFPRSYLKSRTINDSSMGKITIQEAMDTLSMPDDELASSVLTDIVELTRREINNAHRSLSFTRKYEPTPPGPRPHPEAGGMDHHDWELAAGEFATYDKWREIGDAEERLEFAEHANRFAIDIKKGIDSGKGNPIIVKDISDHERKRLVAFIKKSRDIKTANARYSEKKKGAEIGGSSEATRDIDPKALKLLD